MKRSDKYTDDYIEQRYESQRPHYNTYYQPIGKPPKKKKSKRIFLKAIIHGGGDAATYPGPKGCEQGR